jgi:putative ATPase
VDDLWSEGRAARRRAAEPLAERVRPTRLAEVVGQERLTAAGGLLTRLVAAGRVGSLILHGPPGTGKTTLARLLAVEIGGHFESAHAALIGVARIREVIEQAGRRLEESGRPTLLFLDEIHRFSKSQQDSLLADLERGTLSLVGATTENPAFAVHAALLSRSTLAEVRSLSEDSIRRIVARSLQHPRAFPAARIDLAEAALDLLARRSDGDARRALSALEIAVASSPAGNDGTIRVGLRDAEEAMQRKALRHDRDGDAHHDLLSAFIKSMRASDPDAAVFWLARLLAGGEDPRLIARRIAILASEDIGLADPQALPVAAAAWAVAERVGMPECQLTLAQAAIHMCLAPKSDAVAKAIWTAMAEAEESPTVAVPEALRDPRSRDPAGRSPLAAGDRYRSPHAAEDGLGTVELLPQPRRFYEPSDRGFEIEIARRLASRRKAVEAAARPFSADAAASAEGPPS